MNNAEEKIQREIKSKGAQKDREREERLLTSTEGHREEEITTSFFRIQESGFIWALKCANGVSAIQFNNMTESCWVLHRAHLIRGCNAILLRIEKSGFCRRSRRIHTVHMQCLL